MHVVRHDHEVGDRGAGKLAVHGHQRRLHRLPAGQQRRPAPFIDQLGKRSFPPFQRDGHEKELPPAMVELHFHTAGIMQKGNVAVKGGTSGRLDTRNASCETCR